LGGHESDAPRIVQPPGRCDAQRWEGRRHGSLTRRSCLTRQSRLDWRALVESLACVQPYRPRASTARIAQTAIGQVRAREWCGIMQGVGWGGERCQTRAGVPELRELFATLLAAGMDSESAPRAHPTFADIIRQLTGDEARLLRTLAVDVEPTLAEFQPEELKDEALVHARMRLAWEAICTRAKLEREESLPEYVSNLERLGLIEFRDETFTVPPTPSQRLSRLGQRNRVYFTAFGGQFARICMEVLPGDVSPEAVPKRPAS
jgi:hypothetical protein